MVGKPWIILEILGPPISLSYNKLGVFFCIISMYFRQTLIPNIRREMAV